MIFKYICRSTVACSACPTISYLLRAQRLFFACGPGRFLSAEQFWQFTARFPFDLQLEICRTVPPQDFVLGLSPAGARAEPVSGHLVQPPLEELTFSLLSLGTTTQQKLLQHLAIRDLVYFAATCSELFDITINNESWDTDNSGYFQSLPSQLSFRDTAVYSMHPTAHVRLRSTKPMTARACVVLSSSCKLHSIVLGVSGAASRRDFDVEKHCRCSCTVTAPFQMKCRTTVVCWNSEQVLADVSCPFLVSDRSIHILELLWEEDSFTLQVDGRQIRCVRRSSLNLQLEAFVYVYCIGHQVCEDTVQLGFATCSKEHNYDVSGGSSMAAHDFGCLPHILQITVVGNVTTMADLLHLRLCSKALSELLQEESVLRSCVVDLREAKPRAFRPGSTLLRLMHALLQARTLKVQYRHMQAVPLDSPVGVEVYWAGQTYVRRDINFRSWRAMHPVYRHASMEIAVSSDTRVLVLGIKNLIQNSPPMSRMWATLQNPFSEWPLLSTSDEPEVLVPCNLPAHRGVRWLLVSLEWDSSYFAVFLDDEPLCYVDTPGSERIINSWAYPYIVSLGTPQSPPLTVITKPFWRARDTPNPGCTVCAACHRSSEATACCLDCQRWFCGDHGFAAVQVCLGCMDELYVLDRLGGTTVSVIDLKRLKALRRKQLAVPCNIDAVDSLALKVWEVESRIRSRSPARRSVSFNRLCWRCAYHVPENAIDQDNYEYYESRIQSLLASGHYDTVPAFSPPPGLTSLCDHGLEHVLPFELMIPSLPRPVLDRKPQSFDVEHLELPPVLDHLSRLHGHERDSHLRFEEVGHLYYWKNQVVRVSVTGLIHLFASTFNEKEVILSMRQGSNWPRAPYIKPYASLDLLRQLQNIPGTNELVAMLQVLPHDRDLVARHVQQLISNDPMFKEVADMVSMTSQEITQHWAQMRRMGAAQGTWMHAQLECLLNGGCVSSRSVEVASFLRFVFDGGIGSACAYRTEWRIYASEESVAGSIDFVAREPDGSLVLFDWKRARNLKDKHAAFGKFMKSPIQHVPDASLWHYRLQLNVYRWILEQYYDAQVSAMYVVSFHPDNAVFTDKVPDMQKEANAIMTFQRYRIREGEKHAGSDLVGGSDDDASDDVTFTQQVEQEEETQVATLAEIPPLKTLQGHSARFR